MATMAKIIDWLSNHLNNSLGNAPSLFKLPKKMIMPQIHDCLIRLMLVISSLFFIQCVFAFVGNEPSSTDSFDKELGRFLYPSQSLYLSLPLDLCFCTDWCIFAIVHFCNTAAALKLRKWLTRMNPSLCPGLIATFFAWKLCEMRMNDGMIHSGFNGPISHHPGSFVSKLGKMRSRVTCTKEKASI